MRIKASLTGQPITVLDLPDAVAMGAALLAGIGSGLYRGLADGQQQMRRDERVVAPDPAEHAFYERFVHEVYASAYPIVRPLHEASRRLLASASGAAAPEAAGADG
jgi:xylulokinase